MYLFFLERNPHGIFATGGAYVPTQEKKKKKVAETQIILNKDVLFSHCVSVKFFIC